MAQRKRGNYLRRKTKENVRFNATKLPRAGRCGVIKRRTVENNEGEEGKENKL